MGKKNKHRKYRKYHILADVLCLAKGKDAWTDMPHHAQYTLFRKYGTCPRCDRKEHNLFACEVNKNNQPLCKQCRTILGTITRNDILLAQFKGTK